MTIYSQPMARELGRRGIQRSSVVMPSYKMKSELRVESMLEWRTALALDIDPRVRSIRSQPFSLRLDTKVIYPDQRTARKAGPMKSDDPDLELVYTPDFCVELVCGSEVVVETKTEKEARLKAEAIARRRQVLEELGYGSVVVTEDTVGHEFLSDNIVKVRDAMAGRSRYDMHQLMSELEAAVKRCSRVFSLADLRSSVGDVTILLGLASGVIGCDLTAGALGNATEAWAAFGALDHLQLIALEQ